MATLANLKNRVLLLLKDTVEVGSDPIAGKQHDAQLLIDSIYAGIDAILPWVGKPSVATLDGDGSTVQFALPSDLYRIVGVWDGIGKTFIPMADTHPGSAFESSDIPLMYLEYPSGYITLSSALSTNDGKLYYTAAWGKPALDTDALEPPDIAHTGIVLFAASYCMLPDAAQSAQVGQWKSKVDSGLPIHNPRADHSLHLLKRFETEMNRHTNAWRNST